MKIRLQAVAVSMLLALVMAALVVPAARAQASGLYFLSTGHHLTDEQGFLAFWRAHDGERLLGFPVAEAQSLDGVVTQYFERGRLEQQVDAAGAIHVVTGRVGTEYAEALWKRFAPMPPHRPAAGEQVFSSTGHSLREPFLTFWQAGGGLEFFGAPISEPTWELTARGRQQVQYFERARLERDPQMAGVEEIQVGNLGRALAVLRGVDLAPVANIGYESFGPPAPVQPDTAPLVAPQPTAPPPVAPPPAAAATPKPQPKPQPKAAPAAGGTKRIVVNLSDQWVYAYEGQRQVFDAPISTGRNGMETPTGTYSIYAKLKSQTMDGVTDGKRWVVPDVPNVMYINGGVALHGTYWHNRFGTGARVSHGCVNLPLDAAAWLYNWAPMGSRVDVTY